MKSNLILQKDVFLYMLLTSIVICGLASSVVTAQKVVYFGLNFPYSNLVFSIFTFPIIDCICELWGKAAARRTVFLALMSQVIIVFFVQLSIYMPHPDFWQLQPIYKQIVGSSLNVVGASVLAFGLSQLLDIFIYQKIKDWSSGKWLWLRSNISTYLGQALDSLILVSIVFYASDHKLTILGGSILVKIVITLLMTPIVYLIVISINRHLRGETLAFRQ